MGAGDKIWASFASERKSFDRKEDLAGETNGILVGDVHWSITDTELEKICSEFGDVKQVVIWYDMSGYTRGIATVLMSDADEATKVFEGLNGKKVKNLALNTCYTKLGEKKQDKKKAKKKALKTKVFKTKSLEKKMAKINIDKDGQKKKESKAGKAMKKKRGRRTGTTGKAKFA